MKKLIYFVALCLFGMTAAVAQEATAQIQFEEKSHDFGDIKQGEVVTYTFNFENVGKAPLVLSNVQTTCGCTATDWPRDPIMPGAKSSITARFNSTGKMGRQNKVITVISNAGNSPERVSIVTNVLKPAPAEESESAKKTN
ncbi:MAG: DUF1573 domain-containing protein [Catalinimonas sp.]